MGKTNLKALSGDELKEFVKTQGLPVYRAKQLIHWIYEKRADGVDKITELSKDLRKKLSEISYISNLMPLERKTSSDGTEKFLFGLEDGESIESVLIPDEDRLTLCISSQAGCAMGCKFCLTGAIGLRRNLKAYEIVDQVINVGRIVVPKKITNIVFMGMGEPLHNLDEVSEAIERLREFMHFSGRRITVSTAGFVPKILELSKRAPQVNLAVSLNATTDETRGKIMPINKKYPIKALMDSLRKYPLSPRRTITFEYVIIKGLNDSAEDARRLINLIKGIPSKVNLIPFNEYEGCGFKRPEEEAVLSFQKILTDGGMTALIRKSKGRDIFAACGQLRAGYS
jgi:23S rRNA (adenine2503-C2)-methyltransferase